MTYPEPMSFHQQITILFEMMVDATGKPHSANAVAAQTGISQQTILNFITGTIQNPRLDNLRTLCRFFGISLDYFDCQTEAECRAFLAQHQINTQGEIIHEIAAQTESLSAKGKRNVLAVLLLIERATNRFK